MADLLNRSAVVEVEGIVTRLRGVSSARAVADERGSITEIHVVADESRHPKQVSRDIESALLSQLGIRIDHRIVSIAQMKGGREAAVSEVRLKFMGIDYSLDRTTARARVTVSCGDDSFSGIASTSISPELDQEKLVAKATLEAVEEFLRTTGLADGAPTFELRDYTKVKSDSAMLIVATVRLVGGRRDEDLVGSALVRDDPWRAAASAVLDALNRRLTSLCA
jgi:hypothetical protein